MIQQQDATAHLRGLNGEQRRAVLHTEGPVLILAGAGSGKTKTLVHRIVHLIRGRGVNPARIAVVTFTNRAAEEMRERVRAFAGDEARLVTISTFHALGLRVLRDHGHRVGLPKRFAVYGQADQLAALRTACAEIAIDDDRFDLKRILRRISDWKGKGIPPADAVHEIVAQRARGTRADDYAVLAADAYARYDDVLRACGAVDFDDLLLLPVRLLRGDEEVRRALWKRWHYLMIDEYQDTNGIQLELARLLAGNRRNLCVVGDDDQSIYAFRGADLGNILEFESHFPGAAVVTLEENYRSTRRILAAANAVIAANPFRHPKQLRTANGIGARIDHYEHEDEEGEADTVGKEIALRRFREGRRWGDFAVLYRANTQARPVEEALRAQNIPYRVIGGTSFFDRKEIADALAYLRAVAHPGDEVAIRRIINYPTRGIGRATVLRIAETAQRRRRSFWRTLAAAGDGSSDAGAGGDGDARSGGEDAMGAAQARAIAAFVALIEEARAGLEAAEAAAEHSPGGAATTPLAAWAGAFLLRLGLEAEIRADPRNGKGADARVDNLRDLLGTIARYERRVWAERDEALAAGVPDPDWRPPKLADALSRLMLREMNEEADDAREDDATVALMTLHSAKGLEFPEVFLIGLEEGLLPHARSLEEDEAAGPNDGLSEERRLLYVGITRARQRLTLSCCRNRRRGGTAAPVLPSRFLEEIPADLLNLKTAEKILSEAESQELKQNFFQDMKRLLAE
jgi:DNA helicase II / ATP-dependent DNA helicase PcrA